MASNERPYSESVPEFTVQPSPNAPSPSTGYDVNATRLNPKRRETALKLTNATLNNSQAKIKFFCPEIIIQTDLSGTTGQGPYVRDFYPHNINIPSVIVGVEFLSQEDAAVFAEFVRQSQRLGVSAHTLTQLNIYEGGIKTNYPKMKGRHVPLLSKGYIKEVSREVEHWVYAPEFTFEYILAAIHVGYLTSVTQYVSPGATFLEILKGLEGESKIQSEEREEERKKAASEAAYGNAKTNQLDKQKF